MSLEPATIRRIATLARIHVEDAELASLAADLNGILGWIEQLNEVNVDGIEPLAGAQQMALKMRDWRAADGVKFDSWEDHPQPEMKDGKPVMGPDNKPIMKAPEPLEIPQGVGRVIPGFDFGLEGMKIGGKRRIFIPWQMAYGTHNIPDRPDHPGIPAKSDLIFDVELVDVTELPQPQMRPGMPGMPGGHPTPNATPPHPGASSQPGAAPVAPGATAPGTAPATKSEAPTQPATAPAQPPTTPQTQSTTPPPQK